MTLFRLSYTGAKPSGNPFDVALVVGYWGRWNKNDQMLARTALIEATTEDHALALLAQISPDATAITAERKAWAFSRPGGGS